MNALVLVCSVLLAGADPAKASDDDLKAYQDAKAQAKRDPAAHVRLALWCEAHGLEAERLKHLAIAVLADPQNATARGLMGLVSYHGQWKKPADVAAKVRDDAALAAALAEYNARRDKTPKTAEAQWKLALWCEEKGLKAESLAHLTAVTRLDPGREAAWKRLGCKKHNGRWMSEAQIAAEKAETEAQKKADRSWTAKLEKWREWLGHKSKQAEAERLLSEVEDPRAIPAIAKVFGRGGEADQSRAVQLLGQIESPRASRALAMLSIFSSSAEVQRTAAEVLKRRDLRDFYGWLISLLRDPIKYEVRPVGGPGSPGALFVGGKRFNVQRLYMPPPMPRMPIFPGDTIFYDDSGSPWEFHFAGAFSLVDHRQVTPAQYFGSAPTDPKTAQMIQQAHGNAKSKVSRTDRVVSVNSITTGWHTIQIPIGQLILQTQQAAIAAEQQLEIDLAEVKAFNALVRSDNDRVSSVLKSLGGVDLGQDREAWTAWWTDQQGYVYKPPQEPALPTLVQTLTPQVGPVPVIPTTSLGSKSTVATGSWHSCFKSGTPVRTLSGSQPIESIELGDQLLTQNTKTGALSFQPVVAVFHNKPAALFRIDFGEESISATAIHRFWKAGHGWTMTRDLKPGDRIRTLSGTLTVRNVEEEGVEPVFNLEVASGQSFFVGQQGALVHDNSLVEPVTNPFDAEPTLTAAKPLATASD